MPRFTGSRNRGKTQARLGALLLGAAILAAMTIGGVFIHGKLTSIGVDERSCRTDDGTYSVTAILIDATDPFTARQREQILNSILTIANRLNQYDQIAIYSLKAQKDVVLSPELVICKPLDPKDFNALTQNAKKIQKEFNEKFLNKLSAILSSAVDGKTADTSPILEALSDISARTFQKAPNASRKRLIVVSDLIQNSSGISHYRLIPTMAQFKDLPNAHSLLPRLNGVEVCFGYLDRPTANRVQNRAHTDFWVGIVELANGSISPCPPLTGDQSFLMRLG